MSSPPERSWMLATPIGSSAQALAGNAPAAAAAAVPCKNLLRLTFIALFLRCCRTVMRQIFFQHRRAHRVFWIDHVAGRNASGPAWKHRRLEPAGVGHRHLLNHQAKDGGGASR